VATFLDLRHLLGVTRGQYVAAQQAAIDAADEASASGLIVQYLGGFFIPERGRAKCIFGADSLADVTTVNERAGVPFTEVLEVIELQPRRGMTDTRQPGAACCGGIP
jgi:hypothetical protein